MQVCNPLVSGYCQRCDTIANSDLARGENSHCVATAISVARSIGVASYVTAEKRSNSQIDSENREEVNS